MNKIESDSLFLCVLSSALSPKVLSSCLPGAFYQSWLSLLPSSSVTLDCLFPQLRAFLLHFSGSASKISIRGSSVGVSPSHGVNCGEKGRAHPQSGIERLLRLDQVMWLRNVFISLNPFFHLL